MALPLILRNYGRSQGISNLLKNSKSLSINSRKAYSGIIANARKNSSVIIKKTPSFVESKRCMSGDHSKLWQVEKIVTLALLGVTPAAFISPSLVLDDALAILSVIHFHWGLEACVVDYVRPIIFGSAIPKVTLGLLYLLSFATLGGLLYYNHECIGIGATAKKLWAIQK